MQLSHVLVIVAWRQPIFGLQVLDRVCEVFDIVSDREVRFSAFDLDSFQLCDELVLCVSVTFRVVHPHYTTYYC